MTADAPTPQMSVIPGRATPFSRYRGPNGLPSGPMSRVPTADATPPEASVVPAAPTVVVTPPATVVAPAAAPAAAPTARLTTRIPNRQPAPQGVDKWQHNNALALGVLTGNETAEERQAKIKAYMEKAGASGTDPAAFSAQLQKDAIALQQRLKAAGLYTGAIDGKLGDLSAAGIEAGRQRLPENMRDLPPVDLLRQQPAPAPAPAAAPVLPPRPRTVPSPRPGG